MKKNQKWIAFAIVVCAISALNVKVVLGTKSVDNLFDGLLVTYSDEPKHPCPSPYDPYGYKLGSTVHKGSATVSAEGEFSIMGKLFRLSGVRAGAICHFTFILKNCDVKAERTCCPYQMIGQITNVTPIGK